jgi:hypothetical protein
VFSFGDVEAAAYFMLDDGIGLLLGCPLIESGSCRPMGQGKPHAEHYDSSHANPIEHYRVCAGVYSVPSVWTKL